MSEAHDSLLRTIRRLYLDGEFDSEKGMRTLERKCQVLQIPLVEGRAVAARQLERYNLYLDQLRDVLDDGTVTDREREELHELAADLGLSEEEVAHVDRLARGAAGAPETATEALPEQVSDYPDPAGADTAVGAYTRRDGNGVTLLTFPGVSWRLAIPEQRLAEGALWAFRWDANRLKGGFFNVYKLSLLREMTASRLQTVLDMALDLCAPEVIQCFLQHGVLTMGKAELLELFQPARKKLLQFFKAIEGYIPSSRLPVEREADLLARLYRMQPDIEALIDEGIGAWYDAVFHDQKGGRTWAEIDRDYRRSESLLPGLTAMYKQDHQSVVSPLVALIESTPHVPNAWALLSSTLPKREMPAVLQAAYDLAPSAALRAFIGGTLATAYAKNGEMRPVVAILALPEFDQLDEHPLMGMPHQCLQDSLKALAEGKMAFWRGTLRMVGLQQLGRYEEALALVPGLEAMAHNDGSRVFFGLMAALCCHRLGREAGATRAIHRLWMADRSFHRESYTELMPTLSEEDPFRQAFAAEMARVEAAVQAPEVRVVLDHLAELPDSEQEAAFAELIDLAAAVAGRQAPQAMSALQRLKARCRQSIHPFLAVYEAYALYAGGQPDLYRERMLALWTQDGLQTVFDFFPVTFQQAVRGTLAADEAQHAAAAAELLPSFARFAEAVTGTPDAASVLELRSDSRAFADVLKAVNSRGHRIRPDEVIAYYAGTKSSGLFTLWGYYTSREESGLYRDITGVKIGVAAGDGVLMLRGRKGDQRVPVETAGEGEMESIVAAFGALQAAWSAIPAAHAVGAMLRDAATAPARVEALVRQAAARLPAAPSVVRVGTVPREERLQARLVQIAAAAASQEDCWQSLVQSWHDSLFQAFAQYQNRAGGLSGNELLLAGPGLTQEVLSETFRLFARTGGGAEAVGLVLAWFSPGPGGYVALTSEGVLNGVAQPHGFLPLSLIDAPPSVADDGTFTVPVQGARLQFACAGPRKAKLFREMLSFLWCSRQLLERVWGQYGPALPDKSALVNSALQETAVTVEEDFAGFCQRVYRRLGAGPFGPRFRHAEDPISAATPVAARQGYLAAMEPHERLIFLYDETPDGSGAAGFAVTDCALYTSQYGSLLLQEVAAITAADQCLLINGQPVAVSYVADPQVLAALLSGLILGQ